MYSSQWITVTWDIDRTTDTNGDPDKYSGVIDLGDNYKELLVWIPTITAAQIGIEGQLDGDESTSDVTNPVYDWKDSDADTDVQQLSASETTAKLLTFKIGGLRYVRLYSSNNQAADRTFYVKGIDRVTAVDS